MPSNIVPAAILAAALALGAGTAASAHASLIKSNPAANSSAAAPKAITLTFDEEVAPAFSTFDVTRAGAKVAVKTAVSKDAKTITGTPAAPLTAGAYKVAWHVAAADDGHKTQGTVAFTVK